MKSSLDGLSYFTVVIIHNNSFLNKPFSPLPKDVVTGFLFLFSQSRISARFVGHLVPFMQGRIATDFLPFSPKGHLFLFSWAERAKNLLTTAQRDKEPIMFGHWLQSVMRKVDKKYSNKVRISALYSFNSGSDRDKKSMLGLPLA